MRLRDDNGDWVAEGDWVTFSYGIPPQSVVAKITERDGKLIGLCHGHNPPEFNLRSLRRYVCVWYQANAGISADAEHGLVSDILPDDMPCPKCGGQWDRVMVVDGRDTVICADCDAAIPEVEYRRANDQLWPDGQERLVGEVSE